MVANTVESDFSLSIQTQLHLFSSGNHDMVGNDSSNDPQLKIVFLEQIKRNSTVKQRVSKQKRLFHVVTVQSVEVLCG
jgi:hypothetical protein